MTEVARHLFAHPLPETFYRIQVRTIAWQSHRPEAQLQSHRLHTLGLVSRGAVPDENDLTRLITYPGGNVVQERNRMVLIAGTLVPNETLAIREIVGTVPIDALSQRRTAAQSLAQNMGLFFIVLPIF